MYSILFQFCGCFCFSVDSTASKCDCMCLSRLCPPDETQRYDYQAASRTGGIWTHHVDVATALDLDCLTECTQH
ncbi:hypothetical protein BDZ85DRAFT_261178 [Elsinoe ampelina]|uniref:Secreted protein n=1 Tax=Elsinoe ampelina TaxID=302913 RepID=A0A6A6GFW1_9PEZI|nr:hypothetical protein BDZ85DRAFT_261178 [Elsinoe ampelina]